MDSRRSASLDVFLLGKVDFDAALGLQAVLLNQLAERLDTHGVLLVCEPLPAISIGRDGHTDDVLVDPAELVSRQIDVRWLSRGGGTVVHSAGQVSVSVLVPLERLGLGLVEFRSRLERALVAMAQDLDVDAAAGVTTPGATCRCGQFAFIGVGVRDSVTYGGMTVNVSVPSDVLSLVRWGSDATGVTSLAAQRLRPTAMSSVRESLIRHLSEQLGYEGFHIYTGHPLLQRTVRRQPVAR